MGRIGQFFKKAFSTDRLIGLGFLTVLMVVLIANPNVVQLLRLKTFDYFQVLKPRAPTPEKEQPIKVIDIDEKSLQSIGQWPWSRSTIAKMVQNLQDLGATIVAFDIVFAEPDRTNPSDIVKNVIGLDPDTKAKISKLRSNDEIFASVIRRPCPAYGRSRRDARCVVMGQTHHDEGADFKEYKKAKKKSIATRGTKGMKFPDVKKHVPRLDHLTRNIPILEQSSIGEGFFSLDSELDGIVRRIPTLFNYKDEVYTALSVEMLRVLFNKKTIFARVSPAGMESLAVTEKFVMPTDARGRVWPYFSKYERSNYISAVDIINMRSLPKKDLQKLIKDVRGRMTIVGTSAVGLKDIRNTPVDTRIPGVEVHAQVIESAAKRLYLKRPHYMNGAEWTILLIVGLLMVWLVPKVGAKWTLLLFVLMAGGSVGGAWYLFSEHRILFDPVYGTVSVFLLYSLLTYTGYAREEAQRRQTRDAFGKYLSPDMVARVANDPDSLVLGGEQRELTLLFSDVRGFTTISEQFTPVGLTGLINKLLTPLTNVILSHHGTVDKYMGDCVMAFWNAPLDDPDHARNACISAMEMLAEIAPLNERLEAEAKEEGRKHIPMQVGLGVNTGMGVVGNMGSDQRFDYSVLGDCVNMAARFEGQTKEYGVDILIGAETNEKAPGLATFEADLIQVKGKTIGVPIFVLLGDEKVAESEDFKKLKSCVDDMIKNYRAQNWEKAKASLQEGRKNMKDFRVAGFFDLYEKRIAEYEEFPPPADWDGVFIATSK